MHKRMHGLQQEKGEDNRNPHEKKKMGEKELINDWLAVIAITSLANILAHIVQDQQNNQYLLQVQT